MVREATTTDNMKLKTSKAFVNDDEMRGEMVLKVVFKNETVPDDKDYDTGEITLLLQTLVLMMRLF